MKTRLRDLLKNNKLLNIVSNRYNLDKEDRKTLNEMISNQGGGTDDGMEYYLVVDTEICNQIYVNHGEVYSNMYGQSIASSGIDNYTKDICVRNAVIDIDTIAFATNSKIKMDYRNQLTQKEQLEEYCNELGTSLSDTSKFKRITAKEYYSLPAKIKYNENNS